MNKETIGKVQLAIGIILLIVGIVSLIISVMIIKNHQQDNYGVFNSDDQIARLTNKILISQEIATYNLLGLITSSASILTLFISLLFITQGLANKSETVRR